MDNIKPFLISPDVSIKEAWRQLNENGYKILFVTDAGGVLQGSVTDGDIRRWILADQPITAPASKIMKSQPISVMETDGLEAIKQLMLANRIECVPVLDQSGSPQRLVFWDTVFGGKKSPPMEKLDIPVVIMAGGRGIRLDPFTKILPKPLIPIGEKPILEIIMEKFRAYDVKKFYISLNYRSNMIKAYFQDVPHDYDIHYIEEETPSGTAGSLHQLNGRVDNTFIVSNCDIIVDANYADIVAFHRKRKNKITLVGAMRHFPIPYGVLEIENGGSLKEIREKPEFDFLVNTGLYILEPEILSRIPRDRVYHITHLIEHLRKESEKIGVYPIASQSWMDVGEIEAYRETLRRFD